MFQNLRLWAQIMVVVSYAYRGIVGTVPTVTKS